MTLENAVSTLEYLEDSELVPPVLKPSIKIIKETIQREIKPVIHGKWIPVSERLPGRDVKVMICSLNGGIDVAYHTIKEWTEDQWEWVALRTLGYSKTYRDNKVVAWMPLPEPYKADMRGSEDGN